jgi:hypothetical protein
MEKTRRSFRLQDGTRARKPAFASGVRYGRTRAGRHRGERKFNPANTLGMALPVLAPASSGSTENQHRSFSERFAGAKYSVVKACW